jgi:FkbM family methyltransferase
LNIKPVRIFHLRFKTLEKKIADLERDTNNITLLLKLLAEINSGHSFQGEINQDLLAFLWFKGKRDGFYIDIGANDGVNSSNTYLFEKIGWKGVCVEPIPELFRTLTENRKCDCYNVAISDKNNDEAEFVKALGVEVLSGLEKEMTESHKERIFREKGEIQTIKVKTITFNELMSNHQNINYVDFLSVDVEGAEMSILKTIDFKKYKFGLISVENNEETPGDGERMRNYMLERGYKMLTNLPWDMVFVPIAPPPPGAIAKIFYRKLSRSNQIGKVLLYRGKKTAKENKTNIFKYANISQKICKRFNHRGSGD